MSRKCHFQVELDLAELLAVSHANGLFFAKLKLLDGSYSAVTPSKPVVNHKVALDSKHVFNCKMKVSDAGDLERCMCRISVRKEIQGGASYERVGIVELNLAEYVGAGADRRFLLQASNHVHRQDNSMLRVIIKLKVLDSNPCFRIFKPPEEECELEARELAMQFNSDFTPLDSLSMGDLVDMPSGAAAAAAAAKVMTGKKKGDNAKASKRKSSSSEPDTKRGKVGSSQAKAKVSTAGSAKAGKTTKKAKVSEGKKTKKGEIKSQAKKEPR
eukprot:m.111797 g.111797  ORF g.111797 m.111797 type:complete len:271 (-) comp15960_c0_seq4:1547-2359(-)